MRKYVTLMASIVGAGALVGSVLTDAMASKPVPRLHTMVSNGATTTIRGNLTVNGVAHVQKNLSTAGRVYAHGGAQVWKGLQVRSNGLTVQSGGIKSDSLDVTGPLQAQSAVIATNLQTQNLQAASMTGTSLALSGPLTTTGKITSNGVDAGSAGISTTGTLSAGTITGSSISVGTGSISGGSGSFSNLAVNGTVNFANATVSGLSLNNINLGAATLQSLTVGTTSSSTSPLTLNANGKSSTLGVDSSGNLVAGNLVAGNITTSGSLTTTGNTVVNGVLISSQLRAPNTSGTVSAGQLTLTGSGITLAGSTSLVPGADLLFGASGSNAGHLVANGDRDVAGTTTVGVSNGNPVQVQVSFAQVFARMPIITLTAASDPAPGGASPKVWVTLISSNNVYTGFTLNYVPPSGLTTAYNVVYDYHVIAQ